MHCIKGDDDYMFLKKIRLTSENSYNIVYDKVVDDLLLIRVYDDNDDIIPSYWRLVQSIDIPPLEIGINCKTGCISSLIFYIDLNYNIKNINIKDDNIKIGNVVIDTDIFKKINDYVDVQLKYYIYIQNNKLICLFQPKIELYETIKSGFLEFYINSNNEIIGFSICNINVDIFK